MALWTRILLQKGERKRMSEAALAEAAPEPAVDTPDTSGMARGYDSSPKSIRQAVRDLRRAGWRRRQRKSWTRLAPPSRKLQTERGVDRRTADAGNKMGINTIATKQNRLVGPSVR